ncbi:MAG: VWA domain-containing protein [Ignavibacteriae bacterium]|nr:VWA domain-containing protein [Ignavibacteria bacterium]MBI3364362.1 VWA domain-containing protein [Ignavibacteriota bacterium]
MTFANPEYLVLLALVPISLAWYWKRQRQQLAELQVSTIKVFHAMPRTWRQRLRHVLFALRMLALILLVIALARPQSTSRGENVTTEGIDIILATDISGSMLAEDFRPNRIEAAKKVAMDFIDGRPNDRIGLVIFAGESFTQCPLTIDHPVVVTLIKQIKSGMVEDGTAIGSGLATAVSRLKDSKAKSRVIILLTDGVNNRGSIDPMTAAQIAQTFGVRVYTIGVGTIGTAPYPVQTPFGTQYQNMPVEIDEALLQKIADLTGGKYFRATDNRTLKDIYQEIDRLEKTKIEVLQFRRHTEEYYSVAMFAGVFLLLELLLSQTVFRKIP